MKARRRNITVSLEANLACWVCEEAARNDTSVSRFLARILKERMIEHDCYQHAMRRALARKPFPKSDGPYLTRSEIHDRACLR
jgi:hypothetical protein